jgi:outer membrane protein OmpA-like peptidoglycan-associated protein
MNDTTYTQRLIASALLALATAGAAAATFASTGCATPAPPRELVDARNAYAEAEQGKASSLDPTALHTARQALNRAEASFADDPRSQTTRDLAYIADRKAKLAMARGNTAFAEREQQVGRQRLDVLAKDTRKALRGTRKQLAETRAQSERTQQDLAQTSAQLAQSAQELAEERAARAAAELKLSNALENLKQTQQVAENARGIVITIPGQVLFASGKSMLLPAAQAALDDVVDAVQASNEQGKRKVIVEGHTDSVGGHEINMELARNRAFAVRDYLVSRGVPNDIVEARGIGPDRPVADNGTADGRAMNRRVEIILTPVEP